LATTFLKDRISFRFAPVLIPRRTSAEPLRLLTANVQRQQYSGLFMLV